MEKSYEKKSRVYIEQVNLKVEPTLKNKIDKLSEHKDAPEIMRDAIREAVDNWLKKLKLN